MTAKWISKASLAASLSLLLACITVNIYFPEAAVKEAADQIVSEVRKQEAKDKSSAETVKKELRVSRSVGFSLVPAAYAQQETTVSNPAIRALKESIKQRFPALKPHYDAGQLGENNNGLVEVRDDSQLNLKDKAALRSLVNEENGDRTKLYAEVARALNIDSSQVERVQKIFAQSWINNAPAGWWVQKENGDWVKKQ
jgi:uncharacterized protein YdbL (DUF1318 family)